MHQQIMPTWSYSFLIIRHALMYLKSRYYGVGNGCLQMNLSLLISKHMLKFRSFMYMGKIHYSLSCPIAPLKQKVWDFFTLVSTIKFDKRLFFLYMWYPILKVSADLDFFYYMNIFCVMLCMTYVCICMCIYYGDCLCSTCYPTFYMLHLSTANISSAKFGTYVCMYVCTYVCMYSLNSPMPTSPKCMYCF